MEVATAIVTGVEYYLYIGGAIAALFLLIGLDRIDPSARGAYAFRPLLIPGICLLWPFVLIRWAQLEFRKKDAAP
ncbi:MAG: hypothetical protein AAF228_04390 [Pseudomonadota bacterium]